MSDQRPRRARRRSSTAARCRWTRPALAMGAVMDGEATPAQLAALLMGLRMRGETVDELAGFAAAMRERVVARRGARRARSTSSGPAATAAGRSTSRRPRRSSRPPPASRSRSTATGRSRRRSGSADVLDALGVRIDHDAASAGAALRDIGFAFMFAPELPPGDEARRPDPPRDRRPDRVQPARAADQPGRDARASCSASATRRPRRGWPRSSSALGTERTFVIHGDGRRRAAARRHRRRSTTSAGDGIERHDDRRRRALGLQA